jgi:Wzt C-terminal domain
MVILTPNERFRHPFSGRVVFDHLPKTAGTSVNRWLIEALGDGNVSDVVTGLHRSAIYRYGGQYCLITGHLDFINAEGLDPRWQYTTILRDPVDRALSWLYYVLKHYTAYTLPGIYEACSQFVKSDGEIIAEAIYPSISNLYTSHFCKILGYGNEDDSVRLKNAQSALDQYDLVGIFEDYQGYSKLLSRLLNLTHVPPVRHFNRTEGRPSLNETSKALRTALENLNNLDFELYYGCKEKVRDGFWDRPVHTSRDIEIIAYPKIPRSLRQSDDIHVSEIDVAGTAHLKNHDVIMAKVTIENFSPIKRLQCGLHILDDRGEIAFGINSTLLNQDVENLTPGYHIIAYQIMADLPVGKYTLGISFYDNSDKIPRELYWHDAIYDFSVLSPKGVNGIGYSPCQSRISTIASPTNPKASTK